MEVEHVQAKRRWAATKERIEELYIFGSRARGDHTVESDLDIALTLSDDLHDDILSVFVSESEAWTQELSNILPKTVDLQLSSQDDEVVRRAVSKHGILIYRRLEQE